MTGLGSILAMGQHLPKEVKRLVADCQALWERVPLSSFRVLYLLFGCRHTEFGQGTISSETLVSRPTVSPDDCCVALSRY